AAEKADRLGRRRPRATAPLARCVRSVRVAGFWSRASRFCKTRAATPIRRTLAASYRGPIAPARWWRGLEESSMRRFIAVSFVLSCMSLLPARAFGQAGIPGVVQDPSGGVLPGVTVEASSPALIEKVRTAVTDGNGRFQIVDLRPGV